MLHLVLLNFFPFLKMFFEKKIIKKQKKSLIFVKKQVNMKKTKNKLSQLKISYTSSKSKFKFQKNFGKFNNII